MSFSERARPPRTARVGKSGIRQNGTLLKPEHVKDRLHEAMHRGSKVSETELEEVTTVVLVIVAEVASELALVIGELAARVEALESAR